jgi:hypothetical protein
VLGLLFSELHKKWVGRQMREVKVEFLRELYREGVIGNEVLNIAIKKVQTS